MKVLHLSTDLILVGKVSAWAKTHQVQYQNVSDVKKLKAQLKQDSVDKILVDLQRPDLSIDELVNETRSNLPSAQLVGYAQHVMTELIDQANSAGFDRVLTRGQFDRNFADVIHE